MERLGWFQIFIWKLVLEMEMEILRFVGFYYSVYEIGIIV